VTAWWETRAAATVGEHLLLVVDGRVVSDLWAVPPTDDGRLILRMPPGAASAQLQRARWLAGRLAAPHPAEIVVVSEKMTRTQ
jgi:hypothetical protein